MITRSTTKQQQLNDDFIRACEENDYDYIKNVLNQKLVDVNLYNGRPLQITMERGYIKLHGLLTQYGALFNNYTQYKYRNGIKMDLY